MITINKNIFLTTAIVSTIALTGCAVTPEKASEELANVIIDGVFSVEAEVKESNNTPGKLYGNVSLIVKYSEDLNDNKLKEIALQYKDAVLKTKGYTLLNEIYGSIKIESKATGKTYKALNFSITNNGEFRSNILEYKVSNEIKELLKLSYEELRNIEDIPNTMRLLGNDSYIMPEYKTEVQEDIERLSKEKEDFESAEKEAAIKQELDEVKDKYKNTKLNEVSFKSLARNPEKYEGERMKFVGEVWQVIEESDGSIGVRIALNDDYKQVVYGNISKELYDSLPGRLLEDDIIEFGCVGMGIKNYTTVLHVDANVPNLKIEYLTIK